MRGPHDREGCRDAGGRVKGTTVAGMRRRRFRPVRLGLWLAALAGGAVLLQRLQRTRAAAHAPSTPPPARPAEPAVDADTVGGSAATWVEAQADGTCPPSHPIKAKLSSKLYHLPGMLAYERTKPDRCYADEAAAEADGLRRAKR